MCCQKFFTMGCISSKGIDETCPNIFKVINVDDFGNHVGSGLLEIKNFELVLYQKGKNPIMWPLRTVRRYGFDADHFSFECGRRCRTGPGIYAFRCQRARQLFNLLQSRIQSDTNGNAESPVNIGGFATENDSPSGDSSRPIVSSRFPSTFGMGRFSTSTSGSLGPLSPMSITSSPIILDSVVPTINLPDVTQNDPNQMYENEDVIAAARNRTLEETRNEEKKDLVSPLLDHSYANSFLGPINTIKSDKWKKSPSEFQFVLLEEDENPTSPEARNSNLYINVLPDPIIPEVVMEPVIEPDEIKVDVFSFGDTESGGGSLISENPMLTTSPRSSKSLNYIVLDLDTTGDPPKSPKSPTSPNPSENGKRLSDGYTAIDFQKTVALSHSIHPDSDMDRDSCRKTRHSSNAFPQERLGSSVSD